MENTFQLEIITPTKIITEGQVNYVRAESTDGLFGIMAKHTPSTIALDIGEIKVVKEGKNIYYATNGGFADIQSESVLLLLETIERVDEIDIDRAKSSLDRAQKRLNDKDMNQVRSRVAISRSNNRLKISNR